MDTICLDKWPYRKLLMPYPPVDIHPPTVENLLEGYVIRHRPSFLAMISMSLQRAPASTVTVFAIVSIASILRNGERSMTIPPLVGTTPPKPHEAAPRGITGIFRSLANTRTFLISSILLGWTTKSGSVSNSVLLMT